MGVEHEPAMLIIMNMDQESFDEMVQDLVERQDEFFDSVASDNNGYAEFKPKGSDDYWCVGFRDAVLGEDLCFYAFDGEDWASMCDVLKRAGYEDHIDDVYDGVRVS